MANYVLIHGGDKGEGTFWWKDVAQLLSFNNHNVLYPSMKPLLENATLQDNIDEVCELIQSKNLDNIILAGHSYGGMVITGVADRLHTKIGCLVYIDSVVPKNGKSLYGLLAETGYDYKSFGFPPLEACLAPLSFSEEVIKKIRLHPKSQYRSGYTMGTPYILSTAMVNYIILKSIYAN